MFKLGDVVNRRSTIDMCILGKVIDIRKYDCHQMWYGYTIEDTSTHELYQALGYMLTRNET